MNPPEQQVMMVLSNLPDRAAAEQLAAHLVEQRLAACVNILGDCGSVYRWQGTIESADEVAVLIKTTAARYAALESALRARHPYQVPEIIAWPVTRGLRSYLDWVVQETEPLP